MGKKKYLQLCAKGEKHAMQCIQERMNGGRKGPRKERKGAGE
jgi:hypothetical protein